MLDGGELPYQTFIRVTGLPWPEAKEEDSQTAVMRKSSSTKYAFRRENSWYYNETR